jgi:SsrA-binding protein
VVLHGHEVKSVKTGHVSLKGAFVTVKGLALYLTNSHIPLYSKASTVKNHEPERPRKLLLKKGEISHLIGKRREQGLTLVPIKFYTKHGLIKLEFGVGRGKKKYDKRADIKKREVDRNIRSMLKKS